MGWNYLDLSDFLITAERVLGVRAEILSRSDRVIALAESALSAPAAGFGDIEFNPDFAHKVALLGYG